MPGSSRQPPSALGDPTRILSARLRLDFCLLSAGIFKETLDSLDKIRIRDAPDSLQAEYYALIGRYYYDLGDFDNDGYNTPDYIRKGNNYMDSALSLYPPGSFNYGYYHRPPPDQIRRSRPRASRILAAAQPPGPQPPPAGRHNLHPQRYLYQ